jgi:threonine dehydratase
VRGALVALDAIRARHGKGARVVAASAGNHGAGVAYAARVVGVRARVHVPSSAPRAKRDRIAAYGAEVVVCPTPHYDDAEALAVAEAKREGTPYLSPYDDLDVLAGNGASLAYEIARAVGRVPDRVIAPLGGGGLLTGIACGLADEAGEDACGERRRAWGFQSEACPAAAQSLETGRAVERLEATDTLADGLEGGISARGFARVRAVAAGVGVVTEESVAAAMAYGVRDLGLVLEGSAACALAPVLEGLPEALRGGDLAVVLTGRNVDGETLARILAR